MNSAILIIGSALLCGVVLSGSDATWVPAIAFFWGGATVILDGVVNAP